MSPFIIGAVPLVLLIPATAIKRSREQRLKDLQSFELIFLFVYINIVAAFRGMHVQLCFTVGLGIAAPKTYCDILQYRKKVLQYIIAIFFS